MTDWHDECCEVIRKAREEEERRERLYNSGPEGRRQWRAERTERERQFVETYRKSATFDPDWLRELEEELAERDRREETVEAEMLQAEAMEHFLAKECGARPKLSKQGFIDLANAYAEYLEWEEAVKRAFRLFDEKNSGNSTIN